MLEPNVLQQLEAVARPLMLARMPKSLTFYRKLGQRALLPPGSGEIPALALPPAVPPPPPPPASPVPSVREAAAATVAEGRGMLQ